MDLDLMLKVMSILRPCSEMVSQRKLYVVSDRTADKQAKLEKLGFEFRETEKGAEFRNSQLEILLRKVEG